jgi:hypothetical protein
MKLGRLRRRHAGLLVLAAAMAMDAQGQVLRLHDANLHRRAKVKDTTTKGDA